MLLCMLFSLLYFYDKIPLNERKALLDFYYATDGERWKNSDGWGGAYGTECEWEGVGCWSNPGEEYPIHVNTIKLEDNDLYGSVPNSIAELSELFELDLLGNDIFLPLPDVLMNRWKNEFININVGEPVRTIDEIRLSLDTVTYCVNSLFSFSSNGDVYYYQEKCKNIKNNPPETYCEVKYANTSEFENLARFFVESKFFDKKQPDQELIIDAGSNRISIRGKEGIRTITIEAGPPPLSLWSYVTIIQGVIYNLEWKRTEIIEKCP